jgi:hypothetical protein
MPWNDTFQPFVFFRTFVEHLTPLAISDTIKLLLAVLKYSEFRTCLDAMEIYLEILVFFFQIVILTVLPP